MSEKTSDYAIGIVLFHPLEYVVRYKRAIVGIYPDRGSAELAIDKHKQSQRAPEFRNVPIAKDVKAETRFKRTLRKPLPCTGSDCLCAWCLDRM